MESGPVHGLRVALAFILTPGLWYLSYFREVSNEPLLGGAGPVFYGVGFLWLAILTLIAWGVARMVRLPIMGPLILTFCTFVGVVFSLMPPDEGWSRHPLPWYLTLPILTNAFLFHLTTGLIFVLVLGFQLNPFPSSAAAKANTKP